MIRYRPFRNSDPPAICEIWCSQPPQRGLVQPMTPDAFDQLVLAKPFFERQGMIVAVEDDTLVGFAHAGFACAADHRGLDFTHGATCLALASGAGHRDAVLAGLLEQSERYLVERGVQVLYGGATRQLAPFYLGLYGGSDLAGVLASDTAQSRLFTDAGYQVDEVAIVLQRELTGFRPPVNRELMQLRRQGEFRKVSDPLAGNWWEASLLAHLDRSCYELVVKRSGETLGEVRFWDIEPLASSWGVHALGLWQLSTVDEAQRPTLATFLLGESFREAQVSGMTLVELHVAEQDVVLLEVCRKLGFHEVDRAVRYRKPVS